MPEGIAMEGYGGGEQKSQGSCRPVFDHPNASVGRAHLVWKSRGGRHILSSCLRENSDENPVVSKPCLSLPILEEGISNDIRKSNICLLDYVVLL